MLKQCNKSEIGVMLESMLAKHPDGMEALRFIGAYGCFCHAVDDIIDNKISDAEPVLKTFQLYCDILTSHFYRKYYADLHPVITNINNSYADSVNYENATEQWKREHSDCLRTCGNDIVVTIVHLLCGYDDSRRISLHLREDSYKHHHDTNGNPV